MLELSDFPIAIRWFVAQPRQQASKGLSQAGNYGILRGMRFQSFEDRVEAKASIGTNANFSNVWRCVGKASVQEFDAAIPSASIAWAQIGIP